MKRLAGAFAFAFATAAAIAAGPTMYTMTGNQFEQWIAADDQSRDYFLGIAVAAIASKDKAVGTLICWPEGATQPQAVKVIEKYMADHPETLHFSVHDISIMALYDAFPCSK
jgi:hypothetical protein